MQWIRVRGRNKSMMNNQVRALRKDNDKPGIGIGIGVLRDKACAMVMMGMRIVVGIMVTFVRVIRRVCARTV